MFVVALFVNCVALNIPIRFAEVGVAGMVGLLRIVPNPVVVVQSLWTCPTGMVGLFVKV